jgi:uncharacterized membrane protein
MRKWYPVLIIALAFATSIVVYGHLPDPMPTHWNLHGEVDDYGSRFVGAFLLPLIMIGIALLIPVLPKIDPRGSNYQKFDTAYFTIMNATLTVMLLIHLFALGAALGIGVSMNRMIPAAIGILFIVIGNVLPRVRSNWMVGIRNPWTLSSDRVWERTHRVGGYMMLALGVLLIICGPFAPSEATFVLILAGVTAVALGITAYSYIIWTREKKT